MIKKRIVIADDSLFMRKILKRILESERSFEVVGLAENGKEAIELVKKEKPDLLLLDIEMPVMSGLVTLTYLMKNQPLPIIIVSAYAKEKAQYSVLALEQGAIDLIEKPSGEVSLNLESISEKIILKVQQACGVDVRKLDEILEHRILPVAPLPDDFESSQIAIVIGASTGGISALESILPQLPKNLTCNIFVAQHLPEGYTLGLTERLNELCQLEVIEASQHETVRRGVIYFAQGAKHMTLHQIEGEIKISIIDNLKDHSFEKPYTFSHFTPSIDALMASVSEIYGDKTIGVILTGMGDDGTEGCKILAENGGYCIAEDSSTALIDGMPKSVRAAGLAHETLPLFLIPEALMAQVRKKSLERQVRYGS